MVPSKLYHKLSDEYTEKMYLQKGLWVLLFQSIDRGLKFSRTDRMLIIYQYLVTYVFSDFQ